MRVVVQTKDAKHWQTHKLRGKIKGMSFLLFYPWKGSFNLFFLRKNFARSFLSSLLQWWWVKCLYFWRIYRSKKLSVWHVPFLPPTDTTLAFLHFSISNIMDLLWLKACFLPHHIWFYNIFSKTPWKGYVCTAVITVWYMDLTLPLKHNFKILHLS